MIHVLTSRVKAYLFREYLSHWGRSVAPGIRLHLYEELAHRTTFPRGTWLFSDLDELPPPLFRLAESLRDAFVTEDVSILNDPRRILQRRGLLERLHAAGVNYHRATGLDGDVASLRLPVFVRRASDHMGSLTPLIRSFLELDRWLGKLLARGEDRGDLLVTEFLDTADNEGMYRKYGAFVLGDRVLPRSLNRSREWEVRHGATDYTVEFQEEELEYVTENPHEDELRNVAQMAGVDYGRIDYSLLEGRVQIWEVNLCPTIGRGGRPSSTERPEEVQRLRARAKRCFYDGFAAAWRTVDHAVSGPPVPAPFGEEDRRKAREALLAREKGTHRPPLDRLRRRLGPLRPVLQPVWEAVIAPAVGRFARR